MISYEPDVIVERAEALLRQAIEVQIVTTLSYVVFGFVVGLAISLLLSLVPSSSVWRGLLSPAIIIVGTCVTFGLIGLVRAIEEARDLRFRAHLALLQVEVEQHLSKIARRGR